MSGISCQGDCFQVAVVTQECSEGSGRVFDGIDFVFAVDGNPRWRHLGFLVSGRAGNPAEKAWERVRRHPLFHAFSALALIEYQCSPAKAALTSRKMWEAYIQSHVNGTFPYTSILLPSGFRSLDGRALALREIGNLGLPILVTQQSERSLSCLSQTVAAPIRLWAFEKIQQGSDEGGKKRNRSSHQIVWA